MFFIGGPIEFHARGDVIDGQIIFADTIVQLKLWRGDRSPVELLVSDVRRSVPTGILSPEDHVHATRASPTWWSMRDMGDLGDVRLVALHFAGAAFSKRLAQGNLEAMDVVLFEAFQDQGTIELRVQNTAATNEFAGVLLELDYGKLDDC